MPARLAPVAASLALALAAPACSHAPEKKPEELLPEKRQALSDSLDRAWRGYRAGAPPVAPAEPPAEEGPSAEGEVLGQMKAEAERAYFERQCLAVGRGERPIQLSARMQEHLATPEATKECRAAAALQREVDDLERRAAK